MAIAPIDLQTLFTQLDKAGKTHMNQREGQPIQQAIQAAQMQKKTDEHIMEINEAQDTGEGSEKVNDRGQRQHEQNSRERKKEEEEAEAALNEEKKLKELSDPALGKKIDISL